MILKEYTLPVIENSAVHPLRMYVADEVDQYMRYFVGWLSADIPELRNVEVPLLADSLSRFRAATSAPTNKGERRT